MLVGSHGARLAVDTDVAIVASEARRITLSLQMTASSPVAFHARCSQRKVISVSVRINQMRYRPTHTLDDNRYRQINNLPLMKRVNVMLSECQQRIQGASENYLTFPTRLGLINCY